MYSTLFFSTQIYMHLNNNTLLTLLGEDFPTETSSDSFHQAVNEFNSAVREFHNGTPNGNA